jgi:hypothetical protein
MNSQTTVYVAGVFVSLSVSGKEEHFRLEREAELR